MFGDKVIPWIASSKSSDQKKIAPAALLKSKGNYVKKGCVIENTVSMAKFRN